MVEIWSEDDPDYTHGEQIYRIKHDNNDTFIEMAHNWNYLTDHTGHSLITLRTSTSASEADWIELSPEMLEAIVLVREKLMQERNDYRVKHVTDSVSPTL